MLDKESYRVFVPINSINSISTFHTLADNIVDSSLEEINPTVNQIWKNHQYLISLTEEDITFLKISIKDILIFKATQYRNMCAQLRSLS